MTDTLQNKQSDEISLKDVLLRLQGWYRYLLKKWIIIVIVGLAGAGLGLTYSLMQKNSYVAELTFVLEEGKSNPLSAYMGLASQFGIDLGGSGNTGVFQGDNIMEFLKSRLMVEKTLLSPVIWEGKEMTLADLYIKFNEFEEAWAKNPDMKGLSYPLGLPRSKFTRKQDSVLNIIQGTVVKQSLDIGKIDKKLSFISVKCTSFNEVFSKRFTERLVKEATDFYVNTKIGRSKINVDKLQLSADSLELLLNRKTYLLAAAKDVNQNPARQVASVSTDVQSRDKLVLQTMYGEVIKNLELSKMAMAQETPVVQVVDTPILPLKRERFGKLKGLILGGFLGGFLIVGFLIMRRAFSEIMEKE